MNFIIKKRFNKQLTKLFKKYDFVLSDFEDFRGNFDINNGKHLGKGIYKFRMKNSSISAGKSGGFRIIILIKILENNVLPFIIYSKTDKDNVTLNEIISELKKYQKT